MKPWLIVLLFWITALTASNGSAEQIKKETWHQNVFPIVQKSCLGCHIKGGIGPFSMETYKEALPFAAKMKYAVTTKDMPPWPPDSTCQTYQYSLAITEQEIETIASWQANGSLEGTPVVAPDLPEPAITLPWVDITLDPGVAYTPTNEGGANDDYHCTFIDPKLTEDRYLIGHHVKPGVKRMLHHAIIFQADLNAAKEADEAEDGPGWTCFGSNKVRGASLVGTWVPSYTTIQYPKDTGIPIKAGNAIVIQSHYSFKNGPPVPDRTKIDFQFSKEPVLYPATMLYLIANKFEIPPNSKSYSYAHSRTFHKSKRIWGLSAHMHLSGKKINVTKKNVKNGTSGASETCLINVPKYNFNRQGVYFFDKPQFHLIEKGDTLTITCTWDNTTNQKISWGYGAEDEMCMSTLYLTSTEPSTELK